MRMGIGIGWPNASAGNQPEMVYFEIFRVCGQLIPLPAASTQLVDSSLYKTGDLVNFYNGIDLAGRVTLGAILETEGENIYNISGPVYTECE